MPLIMASSSQQRADSASHSQTSIDPALDAESAPSEQTCYQSGQSDLNQAAAHIWQAGASRPDLIDCQGVEEVIFEA
jgi:hypothetical protein